MSTITKNQAINGLAGKLNGESVPEVIRNSIEVAGRVLLVTLFAASGAGKITAYAATQAYMSSQGVPGALLPLVIATEVLGSLAIMLGWHTRLAAFLMAGFTMLTAVMFHANFSDQVQMIMFFKNLSIAGALLMLMVNGAGAYSVDARRNR